MRQLQVFIVCCAALGLLGGCDVNRSPTSPSGFRSGGLVTESRPVQNFSAVTVAGAVRVVVDWSGTESLEISADRDVLPLLRAEVIDGRLWLGPVPGRSLVNPGEIVYRLSVRTLSDLEASGAAGVDLGRFVADSLDLNILGASSVKAAGAVRSLSMKIAGASSCRMEALESRVVVANLTGASSALTRVVDSLDVNLSGASVFEYRGDPTVTQSVSGFSVLRRLGS